MVAGNDDNVTIPTIPESVTLIVAVLYHEWFVIDEMTRVYR
jgi:hypothetical protein